MKIGKDNTKQIVGYARVSTTDQTIALQKDNLETYGCNLIIEDVGVSGGIHPFKRSNFVRTIEGMSEGSTLVVWKLDRLGRSLRGILDTFDFIQERGIEFVSLTESIQTNTVMGKAFLHFLGLLSELERGLIKERTISGLASPFHHSHFMQTKESLRAPLCNPIDNFIETHQRDVKAFLPLRTQTIFMETLSARQCY